MTRRELVEYIAAAPVVFGPWLLVGLALWVGVPAWISVMIVVVSVVISALVLGAVSGE